MLEHIVVNVAGGTLKFREDAQRIMLRWASKYFADVATNQILGIESAALDRAIRLTAYCQDSLWGDVTPQQTRAEIPDGTYVLDTFDLVRCWVEFERRGVLTSSKLTGYPRTWELLRYLFSKEARETIFDPSYHVLLEDHLTTRAAEYQTPWARRWLGFCFFVRTVQLVIVCSGTAWKATLIGVAIKFGPVWIKELVQTIFSEW